MGLVHYINLLMIWSHLSNDNTCLWLGNLTIFDQGASLIEAYQGHGILSMYPHMYQVSGQLNSSMNNKHLSWNKVI